LPPIAYLYIRGLPFADMDSTLTGSVSAAPGPRVVVERGRIIDLDLTAASSGVLLQSTVRQAKQVCPRLSAVNCDPAIYDSAMRPLRTALWEETDRFETDGHNSVFVDLEGGGEPVSVIKRVTAKSQGFSVVAALAASKFMARAGVLAALAAGTYYDRPMFAPPPSPSIQRWAAPPSGGPALELVDLFADGSRGGRDLLEVLPVGFIWPVANEIRERLFRLGIRNCADLARVSRPELFRLFGSEGYRLADLATGVDREPVQVSYSKDEIVRRVDFDCQIASRLSLKRSLSALGDDLGKCLAGEGLACRVLNLVVRFEGGKVFTRQRVFSHPQGDLQILSGAFTAMLEKARYDAPVLGIEISVAGLEHALGKQLSFLPKASGQDQQSGILRTLSFLERRFPGEVVRLGPPSVSRREKMLALVDPVRWRERAASAD